MSNCKYPPLDYPVEAEKKPLDTQIGGNHYKGQALQPLQATYMKWGYEGLQAAVYCKVDKYLTRTKGDHIENLEKAKHCIEIQIQFAKEDTK